MKKSPVYPNFETSDYEGGFEFDPQVDFTQFLEEARQHAREMNFQTASAQQPEEAGKRTGEEKKSKKSWRTSLFKWWKADNKKSEASKEPENSSRISNPRKGHVSGPIYGSGGLAVESKHRRQTSGPLTNLFNSTKRTGNEIPYMCLDQLSSPHGAKAYGPVYLVT
ncbi:conserved hypothetical protein [Ricinus communis]|uniref:Uncharacterized protein n=1 Tax=Ricinus communis TaxID=3988 RepID=B9T6E6_RICCO|nr:conserved hypothetical protein [Ricinus communis]|eukprot:XP_002533815.1 uncharacterized protein LOC8284729 [Ricinus communis]